MQSSFKITIQSNNKTNKQGAMLRRTCASLVWSGVPSVQWSSGHQSSTRAPGNLEHQSLVSALTHTVQLALANRYLLKFKVQVRRMTMFPAARVMISLSLDMSEPLISSDIGPGSGRLHTYCRVVTEAHPRLLDSGIHHLNTVRK